MGVGGREHPPPRASCFILLTFYSLRRTETQRKLSRLMGASSWHDAGQHALPSNMKHASEAPKSHLLAQEILGINMRLARFGSAPPYLAGGPRVLEKDQKAVRSDAPCKACLPPPPPLPVLLERASPPANVSGLQCGSTVRPLVNWGRLREGQRALPPASEHVHQLYELIAQEETHNAAVVPHRCSWGARWRPPGPAFPPA